MKLGKIVTLFHGSDFKPALKFTRALIRILTELLKGLFCVRNTKHTHYVGVASALLPGWKNQPDL